MKKQKLFFVANIIFAGILITADQSHAATTVQDLRNDLHSMMELAQKTQSHYSSASIMQQEYHYLVNYYYDELYKKYAHLTIDQWRDALDTQRINDLIRDYWNLYWNWQSKPFDHPIHKHIIQRFIALDDELSMLAFHQFGNRSFSPHLRDHIDIYTAIIHDPINGQNHIFKINTPEQADLLHAFYAILTYDVDYEGTDDYYRQYKKALASFGDHSIFLWWDTLQVCDQYKNLISDLPTHTWYAGANDKLKRIKHVLNIAMREGQKDNTYKQFLNNLESLYDEDNLYRNAMIDIMIKERTILQSL